MKDKRIKQKKEKRKVTSRVTQYMVVLCLFIAGCAIGPPKGVLRTARYNASKWQNMKLRYRQPAQKWTEALPVGNGRLGAMVFGSIEHEQLQFNEDTLWTGEPHEYQHDGALEYLPTIRKLPNNARLKSWRWNR